MTEAGGNSSSPIFIFLCRRKVIEESRGRHLSLHPCVCHAAGRRLKIFIAAQVNTLSLLFAYNAMLLPKVDVPNDASRISPHNAFCLRKQFITALKTTFH